MGRGAALPGSHDMQPSQSTGGAGWGAGEQGRLAAPSSSRQLSRPEEAVPFNQMLRRQRAEEARAELGVRQLRRKRERGYGTSADVEEGRAA